MIEKFDSDTVVYVLLYHTVSDDTEYYSRYCLIIFFLLFRHIVGSKTVSAQKVVFVMTRW
jgi:hypothetical protein